MQQVVLYIYHYFSVGDSGLKAWTPHFIQQMSFDAPPTGIPQRVRAVVWLGHLKTTNGQTVSSNRYLSVKIMISFQ